MEDTVNIYNVTGNGSYTGPYSLVSNISKLAGSQFSTILTVAEIVRVSDVRVVGGTHGAGRAGDTNIVTHALSSGLVT